MTPWGVSASNECFSEMLASGAANVKVANSFGNGEGGRGAVTSVDDAVLRGLARHRGGVELLGVPEHRGQRGEGRDGL